MWLDKLALAARLNHSVVCRQVFGHASYSAVGYDNVPNPDYYSALLWQRLVGRRVLKVEGGLAPNRDVRVYAFCAADQQQPAGGGAVTVVWLNTQNETRAALRFEFAKNGGDGGGGGGGGGGGSGDSGGSSGGRVGGGGEQRVWALTSLPGLPTSRAVYLNRDTLLAIDAESGAPVEMPPAIVPAGKEVVVAALSYGFVVLPGAGAEACRM